MRWSVLGGLIDTACLTDLMFLSSALINSSPKPKSSTSSTLLRKKRQRDATERHAKHKTIPKKTDIQHPTSTVRSHSISSLVRVHRSTPRPQRIRQSARQTRIRLRRASSTPIRSSAIRVPRVPRRRSIRARLRASSRAFRRRSRRRRFRFGGRRAVRLRRSRGRRRRWAGRCCWRWWGRWRRGFDFFEVGGGGPAGGGVVLAFA